MKVLFLVHNLGKTRHFEGVLDALTARGHSVVITAAHKRNKPLKLGIFSDNPNIDVVTNPVRRVDEWEPFVRPLRQARDYVRYLHPGYGHAQKLAERARAYAQLGDITASTGSVAEAAELFRQAREIQERLAKEQPGVAEHRFDLSNTLVAQGGALRNRSKYAEAEKNYQKALDVRCTHHKTGITRRSSSGQYA